MKENLMTLEIMEVENGFIVFEGNTYSGSAASREKHVANSSGDLAAIVINLVEKYKNRREKKNG